jgi:adenine-specific DNA-methyltransferase
MVVVEGVGEGEGEGTPNRLVLGDCLELMGHLRTASLDLIYVDPPFATGRQQEGTARAAGTLSYSDVWAGGLDSYLPWLSLRLTEMHRLLKRTGSLFLHLDWRAVHHAKVICDGLFGESNFRNELIWTYGSGGRAKRFFHRKHDVILWYSRTGAWRFFPDAVSVPRNRCPGCGVERDQWNHLKRHTDADGRVYRTIRSAGKVYRYYDDAPTVPADVWMDVSHLQQKDPERLGYPTQKPEALLRRIIAATTESGDRVADFFCGSGTTLAVARELGRHFIGCDASPAAVALTAERLAARVDLGTDPAAGFSVEHAGVLRLENTLFRKVSEFRAAIRGWLGARPGPARQRTIHGLADGPAGPTPLWIPTPGPTEPLTPTQVERFADAVVRHTDAPAALILAWAIPPEARAMALEVEARTGLALGLVPLWCLDAPSDPEAVVIQCASLPEVDPLQVERLGPATYRFTAPNPRSRCPDGGVIELQWRADHVDDAPNAVAVVETGGPEWFHCFAPLPAGATVRVRCQLTDPRGASATVSTDLVVD